MASQPIPPQPTNGIDKKQLKLCLEKAELRLILDLKNNALRFYKHQLQKMNKHKVGSPFRYCRDIILLAAILLYLRGLSYRRLTTELLLISEIKISKSQLQERITKLLVEIEIEGFVKGKLAVAMDATGFKPTNKGDWRIIDHENGQIKREGFIKLMAGIDLESLSILTAFIGDGQTADVTLFRPTFEELKERMRSFFGDGSFDTFEVYRKCRQYGITPVVKPDKNAVIYRRKGLPSELRSYYVDFIRKQGYAAWSKKFCYGKRWLIEIVFSKFKRLFGEVIRSKKEENIRQEFTIKIWIYNALTALQRGFVFFCLFIWVNCRTA